MPTHPSMNNQTTAADEGRFTAMKKFFFELNL